jgi:hypothetical protein
VRWRSRLIASVACPDRAKSTTSPGSEDLSPRSPAVQRRSAPLRWQARRWRTVGSRRRAARTRSSVVGRSHLNAGRAARRPSGEQKRAGVFARPPFLVSDGANMASPVVLMAQPLVGWPSRLQVASVGSARTMPVATARASVVRDSERRNRAAVGLVAGRIHRDGTRRRTGHSRRNHATSASSSRRSMAALTLRIGTR